MKTININGHDYRLRYTIRALFIFEQITGRPFGVKTLLDNYIFFYSIILANNPDDIIKWDDFIDALDSDPQLFHRIGEAVNELAAAQNITEDEDKKKPRKKKATRG